jgi:ABC-type uncharacterized transport system auxiliary subunit
MKWIVSVVIAVVLGGCSLTREVPPTQSFHLDSGESVPAVAAECGGRVLRVALLEAPQWLEGTAIYYAGTDHKFYRYTRARWEQPPVQQLQQIIEKSAIESALFSGVVPYKSLAKNDWLLEIRIERMLQTIDGKGRGETELMLYAVLVDQYSRRILAQKTFRYRSGSDRADVQSAVDAWNRGVGTFREELIAWLGHQCQTQVKVDRSDVDL